MKKILYLVLLLTVFTEAISQTAVDFNNYVPLKCSGEIPEDFKTELSNLVDQAKNKQTNSRIDKKREVEFAELSNYQLNNILYSGKVLYGDRMTTYVNQVADIVLKNEPELRKKLRFYVLKNTDLNAYSTQRGIIFVSVGLLAQIESEAQLAFILCHEIIHYKNNHNLETYKHNQDLTKNGSMVNRLGNMMNYSKDNELEADKEGLKMFLTTPYGTNELNNLFDVLLYSYLPFDEITFDSTYFNSLPAYSMPGKYFLKTGSDITAEEDIDDSLSTHPNIKKRRLGIQKLLETKNHPDGASFINSKDEFTTVQRMARCELAIIHLQEAETEDAFYAAFLLEKLYGKTLFSDKIMSGALYTMCKQKNHNEEGIKHSKSSKRGNNDIELSDEYWKNIEGQSQAIYHFSYKVPAKELNILAAKKMYENYLLYKDDFFGTRFHSLVYELVNTHELSLDNFKKEYVPEDTTKVKVEEVKPEDESKLSKVSKIKKKKAVQSEKQDYSKDNYYKYAFIGYYNDSMFKESFEYYAEEKTSREKKEESEDYQKYSEAKEKIIARHGQALDIQKFVMINPYYAKYLMQSSYYNYSFFNYKIKDPALSPLEEEAIEQSLVTYINDYSAKLGMDVDVIGSTQQKDINTDMFNDYQQLMSWFSERISIGTMGAYTYNDQYMSQYANQYGYIGFCYVSNINKSLEVVFVLFDIKNGGSKFLYEKEVRKGKPTGVFSKMMLYDILHQISQKPTKINKLKKKYSIDE
ncbi:MAG: M48 family metallopeptidase [Chitinophagaceae bacterium]